MSESTLSDNDIFLKKLFNKHVTSSIISMFGVMASVMANSIIAGRFFGADGLAVMSVAAPFYFIFATIGSHLAATILKVQTKPSRYRSF